MRGNFFLALVIEGKLLLLAPLERKGRYLTMSIFAFPVLSFTANGKKVSSSPRESLMSRKAW